MTAFEAGDVVLVNYPFTDLTTTKKRPAIIICPAEYAASYQDVVLMPLTSQPDADASLMISSWKAAGLSKPTWVKPLIGTLTTRLVQRKLGRLQPPDETSVHAALNIAIADRWRLIGGPT